MHESEGAVDARFVDTFVALAPPFCPDAAQRCGCGLWWANLESTSVRESSFSRDAAGQSCIVKAQVNRQGKGTIGGSVSMP